MLASLRHPAYAQNAVRHVPKVLLTIPNLEPGPGAWAQGIRPGAAPPVTAVAGSALQDTQGSEYSWPVPGPGAQAQGPGPEPKAWGPGTRAQGPGPGPWARGPKPGATPPPNSTNIGSGTLNIGPGANICVGWSPVKAGRP